MLQIPVSQHMHSYLAPALPRKLFRVTGPSSATGADAAPWDVAPGAVDAAASKALVWHGQHVFALDLHGVACGWLGIPVVGAELNRSRLSCYSCSLVHHQLVLLGGLREGQADPLQDGAVIHLPEAPSSPCVWESITLRNGIPLARHAACVCKDSTVIVHGGTTVAGKPNSRVLLLNLAQREVHVLLDIPQLLVCNHSVAVNREKLVIFGGTSFESGLPNCTIAVVSLSSMQLISVCGGLPRNVNEKAWTRFPTIFDSRTEMVWWCGEQPFVCRPAASNGAVWSPVASCAATSEQPAEEEGAASRGRVVAYCDALRAAYIIGAPGEKASQFDVSSASWRVMGRVGAVSYLRVQKQNVGQLPPYLTMPPVAVAAPTLRPTPPTTKPISYSARRPKATLPSILKPRTVADRGDVPVRRAVQTTAMQQVVSLYGEASSSVQLLLAATTKTEATTLDLTSTVLHCADLFYVREVLPLCPKIHALDLSGQSLDASETMMVAELLTSSHQIQHLVLVHTVMTPPTEVERVVALAEENRRCAEEEAKAAKEARRCRRQRRRQARQEASDLKFRPLLKRRKFLEFCMLRSRISVEHEYLTLLLKIYERSSRKLLSLEHAVSKNAVLRRAADHENVLQSMAEFEQVEVDARSQLEGEEGAARNALARAAGANSRQVAFSQRQRLNGERHKRESLEKEERSTRVDCKSEEEVSRVALQQHASAAWRSVTAHVDLRRTQSEEKVSREKITTDEATTREEVAANARKNWLEFLANRQDLCFKEETSQREQCQARERMEFRQTKEAWGESLVRVKYCEAASMRRKQRLSAAGLPLGISITRWDGSVAYVRESTGSIPLLLPDHRVLLKIPQPPYMLEPASTPLDSSEMTKDEWQRQKGTFLHAVARWSINGDAEDALVLGDDFLPYDKESGTVRDSSGCPLATIRFSADRHSCSLEVDAKPTVHDDVVWRLLHTVAFVRSTPSPSNASGTIDITLTSKQPKEKCVDPWSTIQLLCCENGSPALKLVGDLAKQESQLREDRVDAVVTSVSFPFTVTFVHPILLLSRDQLDIRYKEGQGDGVLLGNALKQVLIPAERRPSDDIVLYVDMGPLVCETDYIWASMTSDIKIINNSVFFKKQELAVIRSHGAVFGHSLKEGDRTRMEMFFRPDVTAAIIEKVVRAIVFRNDSRCPADDARTVRIGLCFPTMLLDSSVVLKLTVECEDDLTVIDYGPSPIAYRFPQPVPREVQALVEPPLCYFGLYCAVYDADTTTFEGGFLSIRVLDDHAATDTLSLVPHPSSPLDLPGNTSIVAYNSQHVGDLERKDAAFLIVHFRSSSIDCVRELVRSLVFASSENVNFLMPAERTVETVLVAGQAAPVRVLCTIRISGPLVLVTANHATMLYKEESGPMRLGPIEVTLEDNGWDGGYIMVEGVSGWTKEDFVQLQEGDDVTLSDAAKSPECSTLAPDMSEQSLESSSRAQDALSHQNSFVFAEQAKKTESVIKALVRKRKTELMEARQQARNEANRIVNNARRQEIEAAVANGQCKTIRYRGARIGRLVRHSASKLAIYFDERDTKKLNLAVDGTARSRAEYCRIHRREVVALMKKLVFVNTSDNPRDLQKIVRVVASDGLPHCSVALVNISVQTTNKITELRRLGLEAKSFRTNSAADVDGFCLFDDVQLYDPDTFCFNAGYIIVELVGGGDPKGDQLGVLSPALQQRHTDASNSSAPGGAGTEGTNGDPYRDATVEVRGESVVLGGSIIGRLVLDAPTPEGNSNLRVTFCDPPEGASRVRSHEDARALKGAVTIGMLERVLHVITYTNIAPKVKPGTRIYQARVGFDDAEGKLRLALNVAGPLLWNPDYGSEISFREGSAPVLVLPKVSVNLGEQDVLRDGSVEIRITEGCESSDVLGLDLQKGDFALSADRTAITASGSKEKLCGVSLSNDVILLSFDWSSRINGKQVQALLRCATFNNTSLDPSEDPRVLSITFQRCGCQSTLNVEVCVRAVDNPTEIHVTNSSVVCCRGGPFVLVAPDAEVVDPDTKEFDCRTLIDFMIPGASNATDLVSLSGFVEGQRTTNMSRRELVGGTDDTLIASVVRMMPNYMRVEVVSCTLRDIECIVRRVGVQFLANAKDRSSRKAVVLEVRTAGTPSIKSTVYVDLLPSIVELPPGIRDAATLTLRGFNTPHDLLPGVVVPVAHCADGCVLKVDVTPRVKWACVTLGKDAVIKNASVLLDGKRIAAYEELALNSFMITTQGGLSGSMMSGSNFSPGSSLGQNSSSNPLATYVQRLLRALTIEVVEGVAPRTASFAAVLSVNEQTYGFTQTISFNVEFSGDIASPVPRTPKLPQHRNTIAGPPISRKKTLKPPVSSEDA